MRWIVFTWVVVLASCHIDSLEHMNSVYVERPSGYSVEQNWRYNRAGNLWPLQFGDVAEPGGLHPGVIEFVFAANNSPVARYYDLILSLPHRPRAVDDDLAARRKEMDSAASTGRVLAGCDYARALARKLAAPINVALRSSGTFVTGSGGTAGVLWGIPVDLDAGVPLVTYEREGIRTMQTTLLRYQSVGLLVVHSSATDHVQVWDLANLPAAFQADSELDQATIAARIVPLHPEAL